MGKWMNRLWKKFTCGIVGIMAFTLILALAVNSAVVERYYLHRQSRYLRGVGEQLERYLSEGMSPETVIERLEAEEKVLIVYSERAVDSRPNHTPQGDLDSEALSSELREKFRQKGLGFQRFWLWEKDFESALEHGNKLRLYRQDKLNYGILAEYIPTENGMFAIAAIVPDTGEAVGIVNYFLVILCIASSLLAAVLMYILVRHITNPLKQMEKFSEDISSHTCHELLDIRTGDELESVADSMNRMSSSLEQYQNMLLDKNRQMEELLDNVAHDLKTPISLVGMYAAGIRDGLDDGTFLDTIIRQNHRMSQLAERLLALSRIGQKEYPSETVELDRLLAEEIEAHRAVMERRNMSADSYLEIHTSIQQGLTIMGNAGLVSTIFSNLLSNAVKYASCGVIDICLQKNGSVCRFTITNQIQQEGLDTDRIWEPFYVGDSSRNQSLAGTGLGLTIVKRIADRCGYTAVCEVRDGIIWFAIIF